MNRFAKPVLASAALCAAASLSPLHAELDVVKLKAAIETSVEAGPELPSNHSPLFAPVSKPTIETGVTAMTLAVLSAFDQHARGK